MGTMLKQIDVARPEVNGQAEATVDVRRAEVAAADGAVRGGVFWGLSRIALGWVFLWAFLDKAFALGFGTGRLESGGIDFFAKDAAWLNGGHPTAGFLEFGTKGPFKDFYAGLAGQTWVDWVYMLSMLLIGLALILGIGTRLAAIGGIIWMGLFYTAGAIWPENNPFVDEHVVFAIVLAGIAYVGAGRYLGLGKYWERVPLVKRYPILK
ncbi:MAG: DoxX family membrane protein [Actinobacteria bacterium]|nr:MAG: DoxX family membrane protein [Actinomycetota bacterium]